jgi:hypothetical protein
MSMYFNLFMFLTGLTLIIRLTRQPGLMLISRQGGRCYKVQFIGLGLIGAVMIGVFPNIAKAAVNVDKVVFAEVRGRATTSAFSTTAANELLLAFVASDGPTTGGQTVTVTGAGLTWTLVRRTNTQFGTAEIWRALAPAVLTNVTVTSTQSKTTFDQSLTVVAFIGASGVGTSAGNAASTGAASVTLTTTGANSLVYGVGNDWDRAIARTFGSGQSLVRQWVDAAVGDTFWSQRFTDPIAAAGTPVTLSTTAPTSDRWNFTAVEISASASTTPDAIAPSAPGPLTATGGSGSVSLTWGASTDNVGVVGYNVHRSPTSGFTPSSANRIAQVPGTSYNDSGLAAGTYYYRVTAYDAAGNTSSPSSEASAIVSDPRGTLGEWSAPVNLPNIMQHAILLPGSSNILYFEDGAGARVLNPNTRQLTSVPVSSNLFCAGHSLLPDGHPFVIGGDTDSIGTGIPDTNIFDPATNTWTQASDMHFPRWYPTATSLSDGRQLALSGSSGCTTCIIERPEIFDPASNTWTLMSSSADANIPYYPFVYLLSDGRLLQVGATEQATTTQVLNFQTQTWSTVDSRLIDAGSSTMYELGKVLKAGTSSDGNTPVRPSSPNAYVIDMNGPSPAWRKVGSMAYPRAFLNLTTLPNGNVLATGGESTADGTILANAVKAAESWSPATEQWTTLASEQIARFYHSVALLLPDGRVLAGGGGNDGAVPNSPSYEIFSPPYLFQGPRPTITSAPSTIGYGEAFTVETPDTARVTSAVLMAPAAVTHSFDENARRVPLTISFGSRSIQLQSPPNGNVAPPGYYMLFLIDSTGVPSVASWIRLDLSAAPPDDLPPSAPGPLTATGGSGSVSLTWGASTDNVGVVGYNVHRSPTSGFTPSSANRIAQVPGTSYNDSGLAADTYYYRVTAYDAAGNTSSPSSEASASVSSSLPGVSVDKVVFAEVRGRATTSAFSTTAANELLLAFVASDGPTTGGQTVTVTGAGLTWTLVRRTNTQFGTAEIWRALAPAVLTNVTVTSTQSKTTFDQSLTVVAFIGASGVGTSAGNAASTGAASVTLTTTGANSLVYGVGNDWDRAIARTFGSGQSLVRQWVDAAVGDTFWSQRFTDPIAAAGTPVTLSTTAPTSDRWNFTAVEITP